MPGESRYTGQVPADDAHGSYGGTCTLTVTGRHFELCVERTYIYGIEDLDLVRGHCTATDDGFELDAREWHRARTETTTQRSQAALDRRWHARHAGPAQDPGAVLALAFVLATDVIDVRLLRDGAGDHAAALAAGHRQAEAARLADLAASRARHQALQRRDRRGAESARAFAAGDLESVVALLAPEEGDLTRAEAMRLALARKRLAHS